ncbi:MAG: hypothetical protein P8011_01605 [Acidihalobacter sp.]|uniref:hypothetical protein n=1 Tax=Acidihalobacter sp. TaxID=1872108 RepID=UPI00307DE68D
MSTQLDTVQNTTNAEREQLRDNALAAIQEMKEAEAKVDRLIKRQYELEREKESATNAIETAREALETATEDAVVNGDSAALDKARAKLTTSKQRIEDATEQLTAIERVIAKAKEDVGPAQHRARGAHSAFWQAVEADATKRAANAAQVILEAFHARQAYVPATSLDTFLRGSDYNRGFLLEIGLHSTAGRELVGPVDDVPFAEPSSRYVR